MKKAIKQNTTTPFLIMCAAFLAGALGQYFLYAQKGIIPGLLFFLAAVVLFIISDRQNSGETITTHISIKAEAIMFIIILVIAGFFRFYEIDKVPAGCFVDEAQNGFDALKIIKGELPVYVGFSTHNAALYLYLIADMFMAFGAGVTQIRGTSALLGFLTVPAVYFLLRRTIGVPAAITGGLVLAFMRWHVNFSRIGYHAAFAVLMFVLVLYFAYRIYKNRNRADFIIFGIVLGISQNTYQAARLIPVWLALAGIYVFFKDRDFYVKNLKKIITSAGIALIICLPLIGFAIKDPGVFFQRQSEVNIFTEGVVDNHYKYGGKFTPPQLLAQNIKDTLLMFNYKGDLNPKHNIPGQPQLDFITGLLAALGFGYTLYRFKKPVYLFYLSIFALFIFSGFITIEAPQSLRVIFTIIAATACASIFAQKVITRIFACDNNSLKASAAGIIAAVLAAACLNNYNLYFEKQAKNPNCWMDFSTDAFEAGKYLKNLGPEWHAVLAVEGYKIRTFNMALSREDKSIFTPFTMDKLLTPPADAKNITYILLPHYLPLLDGVLKIMYPNGRYVPIYNKYDSNWLVYFAYEAPESDVKALREKWGNNGLTLTGYKTPDFTGQAEKTRVPALFMDADFGELSRVWEGALKAPVSGNYRFTVNSRGLTEVYIDGKKAITCQGDKKNINTCGVYVNLNKGNHDIMVKYSQADMFAAMEVRWDLPGFGKELTGIKYLYPKAQ